MKILKYFLDKTHRVSVLHDGVEIIGATVNSKRPETQDDMVVLIKALLAAIEAPLVDKVGDL